MQYTNVSDIPFIEEGDAEGEVARIYDEIKREMQIPFIPNMFKGLAISPAALNINWDMIRSLYKNTTLPESLMSMILFIIAESKNCQYCSAYNEMTCRTLGIDEATISALVEDLESVSPQRIREIVKFTLKVSRDPQGLLAGDYERVRESGVTDEELVEIIQLASIANYTNTLTDALKIAVDPLVSAALER